MEFQVVEVQCVAAGVTELANPRQLGAGGGGGGEGLFPLRCVTALAAADCRRLAGVSAAVSECSHPSASYHPHWRLCFVALILSSASYHLTGDSALRFEASCEFFKGWVNKAIKIS